MFIGILVCTGSMCGFRVIFSSMIISRNFIVVSHFISKLVIVIVGSFNGTLSCACCLWQNIRIWLTVLNKRSVYLCVQKKLESSANIFESRNLIEFFKLLANIRNSKGPNIEPWRTTNWFFFQLCILDIKVYKFLFVW